MKRTFIIIFLIIGLVIIALVFFNKLISKKDNSSLFAEVKQGRFEISVVATGELMAEKSVNIMAPDIIQRGGGEIKGGMIKILDMVPEGTIVKEGDFIAQLDRTAYDNNLKDDLEKLTSLQTDLEVKLLDSAVTFNSLRDEMKNQKYLVNESAITLRNSKYESPDIIRQAEITLDKAKRVLEQRERSYLLKQAQTLQGIRTTQWYISRVTTRVNGLKELLAKFTITAPSGGMLIYMRDHHGVKRKVGSMISFFDRVVATLPDLTTMISRIFVSEVEISKVKPGQKVEITVDAFPSKVYTGTVISVGNIGEVLPNSDSKVFETLVRVDGTDPALRPSMTTGNKINIKAVDNCVFIPTECIQAGKDSILFVYTKNRTKQVVITGESNEKNIIIEKGLKAGTSVYLSEPENHDKFRISGEELIPLIKKQ